MKGRKTLLPPPQHRHYSPALRARRASLPYHYPTTTPTTTAGACHTTFLPAALYRCHTLLYLRISTCAFPIALAWAWQARALLREREKRDGYLGLRRLCSLPALHTVPPRLRTAWHAQAFAFCYHACWRDLYYPPSRRFLPGWAKHLGTRGATFSTIPGIQP